MEKITAGAFTELILFPTPPMDLMYIIANSSNLYSLAEVLAKRFTYQTDRLIAVPLTAVNI